MSMAYFKRHHDDDFVDEVVYRTVPRYKTSGLSGDEWRVSVVVELRRKGAVLLSRGYSDMATAAAHLPWLLRTWNEDPSAGEVMNREIEREKTLCHQPGCSEEATTVYQLKSEFSRGEGFESKPSHKLLRAFCSRHAKRGDCGLEDSDRNYVVVKGHGPEGAAEQSEDESPSAFGGSVAFGPEDDDL